MQTNNKYSNIRIHFKIWMSTEDGTDIIDDDKWQLLIAVKEHGSLMAAAIKMEISYRKAWGDIRKMENILGFTLLEKHRGGRQGGASFLTDEGFHLIDAYIRFRKEFQENVNQCIITFKKSLKFGESV